MEWWIIVLILMGSTIGFVAAIYGIIEDQKKRKARNYEIRANTVQVVQTQPPYQTQMPYPQTQMPHNPGLIHQPGHTVVVLPTIPSSSELEETNQNIKY